MHGAKAINHFTLCIGDGPFYFHRFAPLIIGLESNFIRQTCDEIPTFRKKLDRGNNGLFWAACTGFITENAYLARI